MTIKTLIGRRWWWVTLIVIAGVILLVRLGIWQLDRLEQRRTFNSMVYERWVQDPYDVTSGELPADLQELEYRRVQVRGDYDYDNQIGLKNQLRNGALGINLVTPLVLDDGRAVLIARGWIPANEADPDQWPQFDEPSDEPIVGLIQESQLMPNGGAVPIPEQPEQQWFYVNIDAIQQQMPYELLPVFIMQLPDEDRTYDMLPSREEPLRLHEGDHLSYAVQWFSFALILGIGYIFFVRHMERKALLPEAEGVDDDWDGESTLAYVAAAENGTPVTNRENEEPDPEPVATGQEEPDPAKAHES